MSGGPTALRPATGRTRSPSARSTTAVRRPPWAGSPASASGRPSTITGISPTSSRTSVTCNDGNTLVPQPHVLFDDSKMWTLDHSRGIQFQSPRVLINEMSDDEREKWYEDYKQGFT